MSELIIHEPNVVVISGTHSSGKSTLLSRIEAGKLTDLGIQDSEYSDFGYGVIEQEHANPISVVTVPESARWLAVSYKRPDFLAENYSLGFQLSIDTETISRIHAADGMSSLVTSKLVTLGLIKEPQESIRTVVLSDRGPLDGVVYSEQRCHEDTNIVLGSPRTGFMVEWMRRYVDHVVLADHTEVPFEVDAARLADSQFRNAIAYDLAANYAHFMPPNGVTNLKGTRDERLEKLKTILLQLPAKTSATESLPYPLWSSIRLVDTA